MPNKKLNLQKLSVQSFVTNLKSSGKNTVKGGVSGAPFCTVTAESGCDANCENPLKTGGTHCCQ